MPTTVLQVRDLHTYFFTPTGTVRAVQGVSFEVQAGEVVGLVGESGSGKTVTALSILGLVIRPGCVVAGQILFEGRDLRQASAGEMRRIRGGEIAMIFQNPLAALNPVFSVGRQLTEALRAHETCSAQQAEDRAAELLDLVGHRRAPAADAAVPAPVQRRHGAAGDDRHGAELPSEAADCR